MSESTSPQDAPDDTDVQGHVQPGPTSPGPGADAENVKAYLADGSPGAEGIRARSVVDDEEDDVEGHQKLVP